MATVKDWLNQKFNEWERSQGRKQSYYTFARYLEVSQSGLGQWMTGSGAPSGDDLLNIANKLGLEIYDVLGLPRPSLEVQRVTVSFANLPPDIRQSLTNAIAEAREAGLAGSSEFGEAVRSLLLLLAPVAPHLAEELWARLGLPYSVHNQSWPAFDAELAREDEITLVVQVNGKVRDRITASAGIGEAEARRLALESEAVRKMLAGKEPRQVIIVPGNLVNIVI